MRVFPGNAAAEFERVGAAIRGAEAHVCGALNAASRVAGWPPSSGGATVQAEVISTDEVGGCIGAWERNIVIQMRLVARYDSDRGLNSQHRHAAMARAVYVPYLVDATTPVELTDAGATLQIAGPPQIFPTDDRAGTIIVFTASIQMVIRVADQAAE